MVDVLPLPPLRQELGLFPAPPAGDGTPAWTLHDPPANKFYLLGWAAFEILSRWKLGSVSYVMEAVNRETTLAVTEDDVLGMAAFLEQNFLIDTVTPTQNRRLISARAAGRPGWALWLLKNYLFIRFPLVKPGRFLDKTAPFVRGLFSSRFLFIVISAALLACYFVSRQWDVFLHSFTAYRSLEGLLTVGCAIPLAKVIHELGHAYTAHRYGCRIPSMGVALVVMMPMLYTDTNEAWKLTSRKQRLAIGVSGMAAELLLALAALWAWLLLPAGPLRGAVFILATTTWIMSIALNASPFMRFDGYFILSDFLHIPNLHQRSFAFGRWWLRERIFGLGEPSPEPLSKRLSLFMVFFALAVWLYRFVVFLGIALLVYHFFFKALGIFLFAVEIGWFIVLPMFKELMAWWKIRKAFCWNMNTVCSLLLLGFVVAVTVIPWQRTFSVPATLSAVREQQVSAPYSAMITAEFTGDMKKVRSGETLMQLASPDMDQQIRQARTSLSVSRWQADQQIFDEKLMSQGAVLQRRSEAGSSELSGLKGVKERLVLQAPFDGVVVARNDEIVPGAWMPRREPLYVVADTGRNRVDAFVSEMELELVREGAPVRFIPDALEFGIFNCTVAEVDRVNVPVIEEPFLASEYGGAIASRMDAHGVPVPETPLFRIRMDGCSPADVPMVKLRGVAHIKGEARSKIVGMMRHAYAVIIREISF